jgi:hypothetical protein
MRAFAVNEGTSSVRKWEVSEPPLENSWYSQDASLLERKSSVAFQHEYAPSSVAGQS